MKQCLLLGVAFAALVLVGCTTAYRDAGGDGLIRPNPGSSSMYRTDYEIGKELVSGQGSAEVFLWFFHISDDKICLLYRQPEVSFFASIFSIFSPTEKVVFNAKGAALYEALEASHADHIVGTTFDYEVKDGFFFTKVKCVAKGYPARVKEIKTIDKVPVVVNEWQKIEYIEPGILPKDYSNKLLPEKKVKLF